MLQSSHSVHIDGLQLGRDFFGHHLRRRHVPLTVIANENMLELRVEPGVLGEVLQPTRVPSPRGS